MIIKKHKNIFFGDISKYNNENLNKAIEHVFENIFEIGYENQVQNDTKNFANGIKKFLEN